MVCVSRRASYIYLSSSIINQYPVVHLQLVTAIPQPRKAELQFMHSQRCIYPKRESIGMGDAGCTGSSSQGVWKSTQPQWRNAARTTTTPHASCQPAALIALPVNNASDLAEFLSRLSPSHRPARILHSASCRESYVRLHCSRLLKW